jgi:hypothetical protein
MDPDLEHDRRTRLDLLALFESQAAQIAMLATMRRVETEKHVGSIHTNVAPDWARAFIIKWAEIEAPGLSSLVPGQVRLAALELRTSVHELNSLLDVKAPTDSLSWRDLREALQKVQNRAAALQSAAAEWGGRA